MKKRWKLFCIIAISTLLLTGCANNSQDQTAGDDENTTNLTPTITESIGASGENNNIDEIIADGQVFGVVENVTASEITIACGQGGFAGNTQMNQQFPGAETMPSEGTMPGDGTVPSEGTAPDDGTVPSEGTAPADGTMPSEGTAPADGTMPSEGTAPADGTMPSEGTMPSDGNPPELPDGNQGFTSSQSFVIDSNTSVITEDGSEGTLSDVQVGDFVVIGPNDTNETAESITKISPDTISQMAGMMPNDGGFAGGEPGQMPEGGQFDGQFGGQGMMPGQSNASQEYSAVVEYTADTETTGEIYDSTGVDENAIRVSSADVTLNQPEIIRNSEDSTGGDYSSFYGVGAAALVTDGTLTINGGNITTNAAGGAGVFSYGTGVVNISDTTITTTKNTSGGIHVAGGGTLHASNLTVETNGESSAAIRSDRGGGLMNVDGGTYTSNGTGSPAIYCTADITVSDAVLEATKSEAICIEGLNSLSLINCDLSGNIQENAQNDCNWNVILYQSMSGDSEIGNSSFSMTGGTLTANYGGMFYTTNTESTFYLSDVDFVYSQANDFFLKCTGNANKRGWGTSGANGADCSFTADQQDMEGNILWDSISTLDFNMVNNSVLAGAILQDESCAGNGGDGYATLSIDKTSKWIVTANSVVTNLNCAGTICDSAGSSVTIVGSDGTIYLQGNSEVTITVQSYSNVVSQ